MKKAAIHLGNGALREWVPFVKEILILVSLVIVPGMVKADRQLDGGNYPSEPPLEVTAQPRRPGGQTRFFQS